MYICILYIYTYNSSRNDGLVRKRHDYKALTAHAVPPLMPLTRLAAPGPQTAQCDVTLMTSSFWDLPHDHLNEATSSLHPGNLFLKFGTTCSSLKWKIFEKTFVADWSCMNKIKLRKCNWIRCSLLVRKDHFQTGKSFSICLPQSH